MTSKTEKTSPSSTEPKISLPYEDSEAEPSSSLGEGKSYLSQKQDLPLSLPLEGIKPAAVVNKKECSVVDRPPYYWECLYSQFENRDLREILTGILNHDFSIYRKILGNIALQSEMAEFVLPEEVKPTHWLLKYNDEDGKMTVVDHEQADIIFQDWFKYNSLSRYSTNRTRIDNTIESFDQLLALMTQFNPYWLLEVAAYVLSGRDSRYYGSNFAYNYEANPTEMARIRYNLTELLETLDEISS